MAPARAPSEPSPPAASVPGAGGGGARGGVAPPRPARESGRRARPGQRHQPPPLRARPRGAAREQRRGTRTLWVPTLPYLLTNRRPEFHSHCRQAASCGTVEGWYIGKRLLDCPAPDSLSFWELRAGAGVRAQVALPPARLSRSGRPSRTGSRALPREESSGMVVISFFQLQTRSESLPQNLQTRLQRPSWPEEVRASTEAKKPELDPALRLAEHTGLLFPTSVFAYQEVFRLSSAPPMRSPR
ncbi:uncharacterized protein LOC116856503 [Lontra canadensis]|uniref:uncharacterized protein LOC116856503 n=1 Tax=Lontra canadensis TaxID=76717 RepID=UPI0013F34064|nr:uncharacterized protein LOC116856503 [Lontra canadensis]